MEVDARADVKNGVDLIGMGFEVGDDRFALGFFVLSVGDDGARLNQTILIVRHFEERGETEFLGVRVERDRVEEDSDSAVFEVVARAIVGIGGQMNGEGLGAVDKEVGEFHQLTEGDGKISHRGTEAQRSGRVLALLH